jgi:restriction system protein
MAQSQYYVEIYNDYLKKHRRVTGRTRGEVELKVQEQLQRWNEQETRAREREAIADLRERARLATESAQKLLEAYRNILNATLSVDDRLDWGSLMNQRSYREPRPTLEQAFAVEQVPRQRPLL